MFSVPDLWVIAVNPHNDTVRSDLHQTLSSAATAFLSHRDFSVVVSKEHSFQGLCTYNVRGLGGRKIER